MDASELLRGKSEMVALAHRVFPGGVVGTLALPTGQEILPVYGKGSKIYDHSGREFLDYLGGGGALILGHCHPAVVEAVVDQVQKGSQFHGSFNEPIIELASELVSAVPCAEMVRFAASGSESTFYALRLARAFTGRDKILKFEGGYHGNNDYSVMSMAPRVLQDFPNPTPGSAGVPRVLEDQVLIAPYNDLQKTAEIIERHARQLAAVIVEPLQRFISPVPGFLAGLRKVTKDHKICLIFDEMVTGFRLAYGGAQQYYGVIPDLATFGKILGGGYPIGAVVGRGEIMELCDPRRGQENYVYQSGSLNGNPVSARAGLATLAELRKPGTYDYLAKIGRLIREGLGQRCKKYGIAAQVLGDGPLWHILFGDQAVLDYRSAAQADVRKLELFQEDLLAEGILCVPKSRSYMSLAHSEMDIEKTLFVAEKAIAKLAA